MFNGAVCVNSLENIDPYFTIYLSKSMAETESLNRIKHWNLEGLC